MTEAHHRYKLVAEHSGALHHLACDECGKEVMRSPNAYRVLRDSDGRLLQGDFGARHSWSGGGLELNDPEVRT